jgi:hypothetical protein
VAAEIQSLPTEKFSSLLKFSRCLLKFSRCLLKNSVGC